jgi:hypothetical protein
MTAPQIRQAARLWAAGYDTRAIAGAMRGLPGPLDAREAQLWRHIEAIKAEARLMRARAA